MKKEAPEYVLIGIPRTGATSSLVKLLGSRLQKVEGAGAFATPDELRKAVGESKWKRLKKITVVRSVPDRFTSAVVTLGLTVEEALKLMDTTAVAEWPLPLQPQTRWLKCAMDVVLTTGAIASFANHNKFGRSVFPANVSPPPQPNQRATPAQLERVKAHYADDLKAFETIRVWHPDPAVVMLVSGRCKDCEAALAKDAG